MKKRLFLATILIIISFFSPAPAVAQSEDQPVVRAVLFYLPTCPHCHKIIQEVLPIMQDHYGDQLEVVAINNSFPEGQALYQAALQRFNIPDTQRGVPALFVQETLLVGSEEIPNQLPGIINAGLDAGGIDWPDIPGLQDYVGAEDMKVASNFAVLPWQEALDPIAYGEVEGSQLASMLMLGMLAVIVYCGIQTLSNWNAAVRSDGPRVALDSMAIIMLLVLVGVGISGYLTYVDFTHTDVVCGPIGNCDAVQKSEYSKLFGLPVALLGLVSYLAIGGLIFVQRGENAKLSNQALGGLVALTSFGTIFSTYLTYLEVSVIKAVCAWCLGSAAVMTVLLFMIAGQLSGIATQKRMLKRKSRLKR